MHRRPEAIRPWGEYGFRPPPGRVRFTRHARQRLKLYGVTQAQVTAAIRSSAADSIDPRGNPRYHGWIDGRVIRIVLALDDPELVITLHEVRIRARRT
jgi:hypothetical protein